MSIKIKQRDELLTDILKDAKRYPKGWKAVFGQDSQLLSNDYYLFHPETGLYLLKEYDKNPVERMGVGGKIARHVDEDISNEITKYSNDFGIIQGNIAKIIQNIQRGIHPRKILNAALEGKDLGLSMPLRGQASSSTDSFRFIRRQYSSKQKNIDKSLEKLASNDGLYQSHM
ncbi:MAG: hypothetical protein KAR20_18630 [Candidatus Heimdallarchaeota archaeon]|nr:hypothetical protein [Candidatus Heimdallarchaeota archaeon]